MDVLSKEAQMFQLMLAGSPEEGEALFRSYASEEEFAETAAFVLAAAVAMDDARHTWVIGPWQCGYDDGIYEGRYDFITFMCQCPECEAEYRKGFEEGMKAEE